MVDMQPEMYCNLVDWNAFNPARKSKQRGLNEKQNLEIAEQIFHIFLPNRFNV